MTKTIDDLLEDFSKKRGIKIGTPDVVKGLSTGNLAIDWQTGNGGVPAGRITELYGLEASGKTTTALQTAVQLQRAIKDNHTDDRIIYLDFEHALDGDYAEQLGIDFGHRSFVTLQPTWLEQGAEAALELIETGKVRMVIFDSVAAMAPKRLKEGSFDQATMAMHRAKLMSGLLQTMTGLLHERDCAAVFINHKMEAVDMSGRPGMPPRVTTPGGRGLKFYASLRLEFNVGGGVKDKFEDFMTGEESSQLVGNRVYVNCVKNKLGQPGRVVEVRSRYGKGFDNAWSAFQLLLARNLIVKSGAYYNFDAKNLPTLGHEAMTRSATGRPTIHGEHAVLAFADDHPDWRDELIRVATAEINTGTGDV